MSTARTSGVVGWVLAVALGASGCAPDPSLATPVGVGSTAPAMGQSSTVSPTAGVAAPTDPVKTRVVFVAVVDGDTIETSEGTVRLIGIDTPERGECGHAEAATTIGRLVSAGDPVSLELPAGQNDHDQHGRLIRYVITAAGIDLGLLQLQAGHAIARYDSTDGYPHHPRQAAYHAAQVASPGSDGSVIPIICQGSSHESIAPFTDGTAAQDPWWRQYSSCAKLKKNTAGHPTGPFHRDDPAEADLYDWFAHGTGNRGDGDNDGLACE